MIDNGEMPIGFTMELALNSDALVRFSSLSANQREHLVDGARNIHSRQEMKNYVTNMLGTGGGDVHANERAF